MATTPNDQGGVSSRRVAGIPKYAERSNSCPKGTHGTSVYGANKAFENTQPALDLFAHAFDAIELQECRAQRGGDHDGQGFVGADLDEISRGAHLVGHGLNFVEQNRFSNSSKPDKHEAACGSAPFVALNGQLRISEDGIASGQLRRRCAGA